MARQPIEKTAAALRFIKQIMIRPSPIHIAGGIGHLHADEPAKAAIAHHVAQAVGQLIVAPHESVLKRHVVFAHSLGHASCIGCVACTGFFQQDMLAGPCQLDDGIGPLVIWQADECAIEQVAAFL